MPFSTALFTPPSIFPTYILPSLPFRRGSNSSTSTTTSSASDESHLSPSYLSGHIPHLQCNRCLTDLCLTSQIISKGFTGRHGRAYLVAAEGAPVMPPTMSAAAVLATDNLPNIHTHKPVPRQLVTGAHTVSDISCILCGTVLGWKYVAAEDESQRYKVGKFVLETKRVCRGVCWENDDDGQGEQHHSGVKTATATVTFDSQDEDECEDLFAGVWSPQLAMKRRRNRKFRLKVQSLG